MKEKLQYIIFFFQSSLLKYIYTYYCPLLIFDLGLRVILCNS